MFIDASVVVAVLSEEPGWEIQTEALSLNGASYVSPLVRFEAVQALARKCATRARRPSADTLAEAGRIVEAFFVRYDIQEIPISSEIGALAIQASATYGKAVGHPARLNFGDCFAYACAKVLGVPLSYKGSDFARTDLA